MRDICYMLYSDIGYRVYSTMCAGLLPLSAILSSPGAVPFVGGSCFVAGAGRWRRFSALGSWTRICGRVHAVDDGAAAAR